jgi:hypothetical protein
MDTYLRLEQRLQHIERLHDVLAMILDALDDFSRLSGVNLQNRV